MGRRSVFSFLIAFCGLLSNGCGHTGAGYLWQAFKGQLALYNRERPLDEVIKDRHVKEDVRKKIALVPQMKKFVEESLGVKATQNYTTYVELGRPSVVWVVMASPRYELKAKTWSFPIAGTVPYLGFFNEADARSYKQSLEAEGLDAMTRGAAAYSTLGWLRDPLLSSMVGGQVSELANLIFHETTHSYVYLDGESTFNEAAASFIGEYGEKLYLEVFTPAEQRKQVVAAWALAREQRRKRALEVKSFAKKLEALYAGMGDLPEEQKLALKKKAFMDFSPEAGQSLNNATLLGYLTYEDDQDIFDDVWVKCGQDLKRSLAYLRAFVRERGESGEREPTRAQDILRGWDKSCR